jgi:zinc/manganese transport system substrate-binding protein
MVVRRLGRGLVGTVVVAGIAAGCARSNASGSSSVEPAKTLTIVAGENFWGSLVAQLAGRAGSVTSIVTDPNVAPHDYESSAADARALATADYVVLNGAGYDAWAQRLLSGNQRGGRRVLTISDLLGTRPGGNPHFWYDPDSVKRVLDQVETDLKTLDANDSAYFDVQRAALDGAMAPYWSLLAGIKARFAGTPVASTESIFVGLARYLGLDVISPPEFMKAVAEGDDPPAASVGTFQRQLTSKQLKVLVYNEQTSTAVTTNLRRLATSAGIPVVGITETVEPPDATFQEWFDGELEQLQNALSARAGS